MSQRRPIAIAAVAVALAAQSLTGAAFTRAAEPVSVTFAFTGAEQTFDVPAGVTSIRVVAIGGAGGASADDAPAPGGSAGKAEGTITVSAGQTLYVEVGGVGGDAALSGGSRGGVGGFNGGGAGGPPGVSLGAGGGGGATDLRTVARTDSGSLSSRLIVAAGGGGGGAGGAGGAGGDAGAPGASVASADGGGAGTATAGGSGGSGDFAGQTGNAGIGGIGGGTTATGAGGGGGGGFFGGGGGAGGANGAGGGGGSNYTGSASSATTSIDTSGTPSLTISYTVGGDPMPGNSGTVEAQVTVASSAACLELSTTAVSFGTLPLGAEDQPATPGVDVTNCSGVVGTILARGTDATGAGASWGLTDAAATCADTLGPDEYHLALREAVSGSTAIWELSTTNRELLELPAGVFAPFTLVIDTACPGSSGAGGTMSMQVVFVATE